MPDCRRADHENTRALSTDGADFSLPGDTAVYAPDRPADVRHVELDVSLDFSRKSVSGRVETHYVGLFESVHEVVLDAAELTIGRVTMVGSSKALDYWQEDEKLHITLDRAYQHGEQFAVAIEYSATPRTGLVFVGPSAGNPDMPVQAWTQGQTEYQHYWFPCHDFPNDRATTALRATVPASFFALSNGKLVGATENKDGTKTYSWRHDVPHPAYLVTLVVGEFTELRDTWRDVPLTYYVRPGREADVPHMLGKTPEMIELFSTRFGVAYPYEKYAQIVPEMFLGAMENTSATTHSYRLLPDKRASLDYSPEDVVAHELVHQWFGDLLTCRDWGHIWLNESFATYFEAVWAQHSKGEDQFRTELHINLQGYLAADRRGRRPIVYSVYRKNASELFDPHVYEKGSLVLHMMRFVLGEDAFWRALAAYTQRNRGREVITADLERAVEETTGRGMARFFEQWVYKSGHPEFRVRYSWDADHSMAKLTVRQTQDVEESSLFHTPVEIGFMVPASEPRGGENLNTKASLVTFRIELSSEEETFYFPLKHRPLSVRFDQGGWLIKTLDFDRPAALLRYQLRHDPDVLGRIEAAAALGKVADPETVEALAKALITEEFWSARAAIADALGEIGSERALDALLDGLKKVTEPKARRAIVAALGSFQEPTKPEMAAKAASVLHTLLERGEPSYYVEASALYALGRTRTAKAYDRLVSWLDKSSFNEVLRGGACHGLGELGEARVAPVLTELLLDKKKPMDARAVAAQGLGTLARTKRLDPSEAQTQAVEALCAALEDEWELVHFAAIPALADFADARAIGPLERFIARSVDERSARMARRVVLRLRRGTNTRDETKKLRGDVEDLREENRKVRDQMRALEARLEAPAKNGATPAKRATARAGKAEE